MKHIGTLLQRRMRQSSEIEDVIFTNSAEDLAELNAALCVASVSCDWFLVKPLWSEDAE